MNKKLLLVLVASLLITQLWGQIKEANQLENLVQRQIEGFLSQALPPKSFLITTSAKVTKKQIPQEDEVIENKTSKERNPVFAPQPIEVSRPTSSSREVPESLLEDPIDPFTEILPGLEPIEGDSTLPLPFGSDTFQEERNFRIEEKAREDLRARQEEAAEQIKEQNQPPSVSSKSENTVVTTKKSYREELEIDSVHVQVILDETIAPELQTTVKKVITDKIDVSFGEKGTVYFTTAQILPPPPLEPEPAPELEPAPEPIVEPEPVKDVDYYLDKYAFLIYLFISIFFFFIMLMIIFFFIWLMFRAMSKRQLAEQRRFQNRMVRNVTPGAQQRQFPQYPPGPPYPPYPYGGGQYPNPYPPQGSVGPIVVNRELPPSNVVEESKKKKTELDSDSKSQPRSTVTKPNDLDPPPLVPNQSAIELENEFFKKFTDHPLVARNFFLNLDDDDQKELVSAFPKYSTRKIFSRLNKANDVEKESKIDQIVDLKEKDETRRKVFNKYIESLEQHYKLLESQNKDVFGQISLLTSDELNLLFSSLDTKAIVNSYQVIDSDIITKYLENLPDKKKNEFASAMTQEKFMSEAELTELKQIYKNRINEISRNIFIDKPDKSVVRDKIFQSVKNKKAFLDKIQFTDPDFYEANKKYTIDFNDMIEVMYGQNSSQFFRAIEDTDNDVISNALANLNTEVKDDAIANMPDERRDFINQIIFPKIGQLEKEEEDAAREELLNKYREIVFR